MELKKTLARAFICASMLALVSSGAAHGEALPSTGTILAGTGSGTIQDVMNQIADTLNTANGGATNKCTNPAGTGNTGLLCNWNDHTDANPMMSTRDNDPDCQNLYRPIGSRYGIQALADSFAGLSGFGSINLQDCFDYVRASSLSIEDDTELNTLRAYQFASDQMEPVKRAGGSAPNNINRTGPVSLARLYSYDYDTLPAAQGGLGLNPTTLAPGSVACLTVGPLVPESGDELAFWANAMQQAARDSGATTAFIDATKFSTSGGWSPCVDPAYRPRENVGSALRTGNEIVPHSCAHFYSQRSGVISPNQTGIAVPIGVDQAFCGQTSYPQQLTRNVYNVIREDHRFMTVNGTGITQDQIFGPGGLICANSATIMRYGYSTLLTYGGVCGGSGLNGTARPDGTAFGWLAGNPTF